MGTAVSEYLLIDSFTKISLQILISYLSKHIYNGRRHD